VSVVLAPFWSYADREVAEKASVSLRVGCYARHVGCYATPRNAVRVIKMAGNTEAFFAILRSASGTKIVISDTAHRPGVFDTVHSMCPLPNHCPNRCTSSNSHWRNSWIYHNQVASKTLLLVLKEQWLVLNSIQTVYVVQMEKVVAS
jgi:hypothetical protein